METEKTGKVVGVNGNMVTVAFEHQVTQNEVAYVRVGEQRLKSEVIRVRGRKADMQVFEDTKGIRVGDQVEFSGDLLSVELGPGLLTAVYDGLQNPLNELAEKAGFFLKRGLYLKALDRARKWKFTPTAKVGQTVEAGVALGWVPEGIFQHQIMVPFTYRGAWEVQWVLEGGEHTVETVVARLVQGREVREVAWSRCGP